MFKNKTLLYGVLLFFGLMPGVTSISITGFTVSLRPVFRGAPSISPVDHGVLGEVLDSTLGKALDGALGGVPGGSLRGAFDGALSGGLTLGQASLWASDLSGDDILRRMEETLFPDNYRMRVSMVTTEASGRERGMELDVQYRRGTGSYMEVLSPARSRGTRFLQRDNALWMFIPRSGSRSAIRLAPRDSFQGSVFSNSDVGETSYTDDYQGRVISRENVEHPQLGNVETYIVQAEPKHPEAAYGRIVAWITVEGFIPLRMDYYVRSGMHTKQMKLYDIQEIAGRRRPLRMEMEALDEVGKVSVMRIMELERDDNLPDRIFTQRHLTR